MALAFSLICLGGGMDAGSTAGKDGWQVSEALRSDMSIWSAVKTG